MKTFFFVFAKREQSHIVDVLVFITDRGTP